MDSLMGKNRSCGNATQASVSEYDIRFAAVCNLAAGLARELEHLRPEANKPPLPISLRNEVQKFESDLIRAALISTGGNQREAAEILGVKLSTLNMKVKRLKINKHPSSDRIAE
jgi:DNA-binding NtrC family response regulator